MEVKVTLEIPWNEDGSCIEDQVINAVAERLIREVSGATKDTLRKRIVEQVDAKLAIVVGDIVDAPIFKTNSYGESKGEPQTMREVVMAQAEAYLETKLDSYGRPGGYDAKITRLEASVQAIIKPIIEAAEIRIRKDISETLDGEIGRAAARAARKALGMPEEK